MTKFGQIIDVIAPARCDFTMTSKQIKDVVCKFGFAARFPVDMVKEGADILCCNSVKNRATFLIEALENKESKFVWALAGGYGTTQLLSALDAIDFSNHKKILVGFSDITALMIYFIQKYKWPCIHARGIRGIIEGKADEAELKLLESCFQNTSTKLEYALLPFNDKAKKTFEIQAETTGGNLSLVQCSLGTNWHINTENKILLLEDIDEPGYGVDRMLVHLEQAGVFNKVEAVILGDFSCGKENELVHRVLSRFFEDKKFPVFKTDIFGHGKQNHPFLLGVEAKLTCGSKAHISFDHNILGL
ncbi:MAG: LD-carboxypeptidase [Rickettsiales bacterium]|nr:LD-carboxypeptidase [Rickettsiales bacterium]